MSTNSECLFIEVRREQWYYLLEIKPYDDDDDEANDGHDWLEDAACHGPFTTFEQAHQHLSDFHANPGGFGTMSLAAGEDAQELSPGIQRLIDNASPPAKRGYGRASYRF